MAKPLEINMRKARKQKNMTLKQLGEKVGVAESTLSQYETGKRQPDNETLLRIAEELETTVSDLFGQKKIPLLNERVLERLTDLRDNPDTRALLEVLPDMTEDQVRQMTQFALFLRGNDGEDR